MSINLKTVLLIIKNLLNIHECQIKSLKFLSYAICKLENKEYQFIN